MTGPGAGGSPGGPAGPEGASGDAIPGPVGGADGPRISGPSADPAGQDGPDPAGPDLAAAAALARARAAARDAGLRPGSRPVRRRRRGPDATYSGQRAGGRDPQLLGEQLESLLVDRGWRVDVSVGSVMGRWPAIVGPEVAAHAAPVSFEDGVLVVRADSTAWATQLRYMSSTLLGSLEKEAGPGVVVALRIVGPSAPSWSRGPRRASGPGPRDTYG